MKTLIDIAEEVIDWKLSVAEKVIEEKFMPLFEVMSMQKAIKKPYTEWSPREVELARQIYGDDAVRLRMAKDVDKKISAVEAEVEQLEGRNG